MHAGVQEMDACMKIIIVGCGRVGRALVQQLNEEGNDITAIPALQMSHKNMMSWELSVMVPLMIFKWRQALNRQT